MWSNKVKKFTDDHMNISGDKISIKRGEIFHGDLCYWVKNPRIYSIVHASSVPLDQMEIQKELQHQEHVKELYKDIKHHGGLIDPIVVIDQTFEVIEGNSRLASMRRLVENNPTRFGKIRCVVLPKSIDDKKIYSYLNQEHIQGKHQWSPYEQAGVIYRLVKGGMDNPSLAKELGISSRKASSMYEVYDFMVNHKEDKPSRYSYYEVYLSNRKAKKRRASKKDLDKIIVAEIKTGEMTAQEFRKILPHVCENEKQFQKFSSGKASILEAYEVLKNEGKTETTVATLKRIHNQIKGIDKEDFDLLAAKAQKDAEYQLNRIITLTQNLKKKIYG